MNLQPRIENLFTASIDCKSRSQALLTPTLESAAIVMADCLKAGGKILALGNGGSASDAMHFTAEIVGRFERERPALPAIALTADSALLTALANDYGYSSVFARQIQALATPPDVLLAISTSGNSENVCHAIQVAQQKAIRCVALTGRDGGKISTLLTANDIELRVPSQSTARIQEVHILLIHCLCDLIDTLLMGE